MTNYIYPPPFQDGKNKNLKLQKVGQYSTVAIHFKFFTKRFMPLRTSVGSNCELLRRMNLLTIKNSKYQITATLRTSGAQDPLEIIVFLRLKIFLLVCPLRISIPKRSVKGLILIENLRKIFYP